MHKYAQRYLSILSSVSAHITQTQKILVSREKCQDLFCIMKFCLICLIFQISLLANSSSLVLYLYHFCSYWKKKIKVCSDWGKLCHLFTCQFTSCWEYFSDTGQISSRIAFLHAVMEESGLHHLQNWTRVYVLCSHYITGMILLAI